MSKPADRRISVFPNKRTLDMVLVEEWSAVSQAAILRSGRFTAALSGGTTPVSFYERLAASGRDLPWDNTHIFQVDERQVPIDHPDSNMRMIEAKLLRHVPIPRENIHAVPAGRELQAAARAYEKEIRTFFGLDDRGRPRFDLIVLGLGPDGHTASLFPRSESLRETQRLVIAVARAVPDHPRISLTLPVLNEAHVVVFMVSGEDKASALKAVIEGGGESLPAALVRPREGRSVFLADKEAAQLLASPPRMTRILS